MAGKTALELLEYNPDIKPSYLRDKINPIVAGLFGFGCTCFINWGTRRPVFSGIQKHILATTAGVAIGYYIDKKRNAYLADRDAVFRHYIQLHPEDFVQPERKKFGDILLPWIPVR